MRLLREPKYWERNGRVKHIDEFTIHRFRGIQELKLEGLGEINLLVGGNNSGKTSVLEALSIFCDPLSSRKWRDAATTREAFALSSSRTNLNDMLIWLFPQEADSKNGSVPENHEILLSAVDHLPLKRVSASYEKFSDIVNTRYPRTDEIGYEERDVEVEGIKIHVSTDMHHIQPTLFETDETSKNTLVFSDYPLLPGANRQGNPILPIQVVNPFSHRLSGLPLRLWSEVVEADLKSETIELLRYFDSDIQEVDIVSPTERRSTVSVKHKKLGRAPLSTFGDGLRRVFTLATAIPLVKNGLLLVDELETAIHTDALEKTFDWLVKSGVRHNVQLFATTHSLEAVDALLKACDESVDLVVYRLQKGKEHTTTTRFNKELLKQLREELGLEVR